MTKTQSDDIFGEICPAVCISEGFAPTKVYKFCLELPPLEGGLVTNYTVTDASWVWWQRTCYCLSRRIIVQQIISSWLTLDVRTGHTHKHLRPGALDIKCHASDWLNRDILASDWLIGVIKYQYRTLIITFLPGLNIITCLHLSHQDHSNIGSLILANKCQAYSLLAMLHHNNHFHIPLAVIHKSVITLIFCLAQLWWAPHVMMLSGVSEWSTFREILVDIRDHYTALSSHISWAPSNQGLLSKVAKWFKIWGSKSKD